MDENEEKYLFPCEARSYFLSKPHEQTVRDWMSAGAMVRCGGRIGRLVLRHRVEGKRLMTTADWIAEFQADQQLLRDYGNGNSRLESEAAVTRMNEAIARVIWDLPAAEASQ